MGSALWFVLAFVLIVAAYWIGLVRFDAKWLQEARQEAKGAAFARAAQAVGLWPHRVDRRADLMRHLEWLATAPELGAATPNPERESQEEPLPHHTAASPSRVPSVAPMPAGEDVLEPEESDEQGAERAVDVYRNEGFL